MVSKGWGVDSMETEVWYKPDTPRIFKIPQGSLEIRGQLGIVKGSRVFVSFGWLRNTVLHRNPARVSAKKRWTECPPSEENLRRDFSARRLIVC